MNASFTVLLSQGNGEPEGETRSTSKLIFIKTHMNVGRYSSLEMELPTFYFLVFSLSLTENSWVRIFQLMSQGLLCFVSMKMWDFDPPIISLPYS